MSDPYVGEIRIFAGSFAPANWAMCQGQLQDISQNNALFSILGTTYGGDGQTTFALPNMGGRIVVGQGQGPGLQNWVLGETQGSTAVTLTTGQVPAHTHQATFADLVQFSYETNVPSGTMYPSRLRPGTTYTAVNTPDRTLHNAAVGTQGGSQPHDNTMPFLTMPYIIALFGVFPSRN
jgi:microcystin-dependent protein